MTTNAISLGLLLQRYRAKMGFSRFELAGRADIAPSTVQALELDKRQPRLDTLIALALALALDSRAEAQEMLHEMVDCALTSTMSRAEAC